MSLPLKLLSLVAGKIGAPYLILIGIMAFLTAFSWTYAVGYGKGGLAKEAAYNKAKVILMDQIRVKEIELDAAMRSYATAYEIEKERKKIVFRTIEKEVIKYVQTNPGRTCFGPAGLLIIRAAARGRAPKTISKSISKVPGRITRS